VITLDTTRADRLGCYGNTDEITPNIDRLAQESVLYSRATSTTGWTLPAHVSLFTGKFTSSHGARLDPNGPLILSKEIGERFSGFRAWGMSPEEITLATLLKEDGYRTGAVVAGPWMKKVMGLDRGFEFYDDTGITTLSGRLAHSVTDTAIAWLSEPDPRPFFLFLNYFDPHGPYRPPPEFRKGSPKTEVGMSARQLEDQRNNWLYDGEIRYMDHHIGRLFDALREKGLYDGTLVIVTADHGELLGEHGAYTHGARLHQPIVHIPLIMKYPGAGQTASTNDERAQLVDILPTVLKELGLPIPDGVQGDALDRLDHPVVSEAYPLPLVQDYDGATRVLFEDGFKFIQRTRGRNLLFDLDSDPGEEINLLAQFPERATAMEQTLVRYLDSLPVSVHDATPREVDKDTEEALRGLGYVD
jgi:arylsulfatase A-like enzyme